MTYRVKKTEGSPILNDWKDAELLSSFIYPWDSEQSPLTTFRALWDDEHVYFRFDAFDPDQYIHVHDLTKFDVLLSDRVEIFFQTRLGMASYYGLEIDPCGRVFDFKASYYRQFDYNFSWPNLFVDTKKTKDSYVVQGSILLSALKKLGILEDSAMRVGLYRANSIKHNSLSGIKWISWIDPHTDSPDFHVDSSFGSLLLVE